MSDQTVKEEILQVLQTVKDPELPTISIVELGMLEDVTVSSGVVNVTLLPTFSGCPALDLIENNVRSALVGLDGVKEVHVHFSFDPPWTTDRISPEGREQLKAFGIAPPPANHREGDPWVIECPYCGSDVVTMENLFGPTACRSILYCRSCRNPFEAMKPVARFDFEEK
ncbi:1,2-phenylacetyl-CoA epoxidase subunit PaaD [Tuberibacillus calidus]|jgi:ring-1,2-phenylacetyl-CoA epoxidase subunit PaaD|uniref:1,2-phenylacetyl-CoA epoxidase subunit PaaD n=1 Tax=Tuberibacillus calidus TaxID=340097 RepID=UPI000422B29E|nr:1,2-phenylacetyl-CoA epoxidase subunit PaaD [Tuberibacillus calidus]